MAKYFNLKELAEMAGVKYPTFVSRMSSGWTLERAMSEKLERATYKRACEFKRKERVGEYLSYSQIAKLAGMIPSTLICRVRSGMSLESALTKPVNTQNMESGLTEEQVETAFSNGICRKMLHSRIKRLGWPVEEAITLEKGTRWADYEKSKEVDRDSHLTKEERREVRERRAKRRLALLDAINILEAGKACKTKIEKLERELVSL